MSGPGEDDADSVFRRLEGALHRTDFPWSLCLVGEDPTIKLSRLTEGLRGDDNGDGKHVSSGFSYWGFGPAIAWARACGDPFYPVMYRSIQAFASKWKRVLPELGDRRFHYVSLGVGTGAKDRIVLDDLRRRHGSLLYVPVDMSAEMLVLGVDRADHGLPHGQVLPVQLDFAEPHRVKALRALLADLVGDQPILFGLLGNTVANFDDDTGLLRTVALLLRSQDRLLLEAATTSSLDMSAQAAGEYANSRHFKEFVTSALWHNTDLTVDTSCVRITGTRDAERAIRVEANYHNGTDGTILLTLPNHSQVPFPPGQAIRLFLTRKYTAPGLTGMLDDCQLIRIGDGLIAAGDPFTVDLVVAGTTEAQGDITDRIWEPRPDGQRPSGRRTGR
ncbi:MAG TPA: L-histidine N(alpha)-methyltransferase [Pilimelia sp.]|nr:L-histidine N(alpha)-methyltransferase [Pilimelia sp.]